MSAIRYVCLAALAVGATAFATSPPRTAPPQGGTEKKLILPAGATNQSPALAPGILVGNTLYLSGQLPGRAMRDSAIGPQARSAIGTARTILQAAGMDYSDVVAITVYLTDVADFQAFNAAYAEFFTADPRPTRTTVVVKELVSAGAKIELTMTAVKTK